MSYKKTFLKEKHLIVQLLKSWDRKAIKVRNDMNKIWVLMERILIYIIFQ